MKRREYYLSLLYYFSKIIIYISTLLLYSILLFLIIFLRNKWLAISSPPNTLCFFYYLKCFFIIKHKLLFINYSKQKQSSPHTILYLPQHTSFLFSQVLQKAEVEHDQTISTNIHTFSSISATPTFFQVSLFLILSNLVYHNHLNIFILTTPILCTCCFLVANTQFHIIGVTVVQ